MIQVPAAPETDKQRDFCTFPFIMFLGELNIFLKSFYHINLVM